MSDTLVAPTTAPSGTGRSGLAARIDRYFEISRRGSTVRRELVGGLTTFAAMAYIVVLNPLIIGTAPDEHGHLLGLTGVAGVTALVAAVMTLAMGLIGKVPFALATGLGLNAFVAFSVASRMSWPEAMGMVVLEGAVIAVLVLTGVRQAIFRAIPAELKSAIAVGIGLFIAFIGFVDGGFVRAGTGVPVQLGSDGSLHGWPTVVFIVGLLVTGVLAARKVRGGILIGIIATTVFAWVINALTHPGPSIVNGKPNPTGWQLNVPAAPHGSVVGSPDLHLFGHVSVHGFAAVGIAQGILLVFTLILSDFFDVMGTTVGLATEANLLDEQGRMQRLGRILFLDGAAAVVGGVGSASSATTYVESSSGIADGARTGLASVVTGLLFVVALFLTPLVALVPSEAADPALVVVGVLMLSQIKRIDFGDLTVAIPAALTMLLIPFTYSITVGVGAGFISYVVMQTLVARRPREVHPLMWGVAAAFAIFFVEPWIAHLVG